jgi:hypothetical protein
MKQTPPPRKTHYQDISQNVKQCTVSVEEQDWVTALPDPDANPDFLLITSGLN